MKKQLLLFITILALFIDSSTFAQVTLETQAQVNAYAGGATVTGDLIIGLWTGSDITDLSPLNGITSITGGLDLRTNVNLADLSGFSNLTSIGTFLSLYWNTSLTNLSGIEGVTSLPSALYIGFNAGLTSLTGLDNLASIGGYFDIRDNANLANISALSSLNSIGGYFNIFNNVLLSSFTGLEGVSIINAEFYVGSNPTLTNFTGLDNITTLSNYFWVENNNGLTSLSGLDMLTSISDYVYINNNDALASFSGLESLATINGYFYVLGNDNIGLTDLTGFNGLTSVGTSFTVESNNNITSLGGFDLLSSVGTTFDVSTNAELTSLNGIEALTTISANGGTSGFQIDANPKLIDISGMVNVDHTAISVLTIRNNTLLSTCEMMNVCTYLGVPGSSTISGNATGCASAVEVNAACAALSVSDYLLENTISIYPNPTFEQINISVKNNLNIERVSLFSLDGRLIREQKYELHSMDVSDIATGIYLLKINTNEGVVTSRIAKQ